MANNYLYFCNNDADLSGSSTDAPNTSAELALYSTSMFSGAFAASATTTTLHFQARDNTTAPVDTVVLTHADGGHKVVVDELTRIINATNNPFQVVSDKENSIFNITGVTACAITTADTP
mgnify:CR=1 FL=1|tara:strand:- start:653 stop:1012 length:360 start_codon:yes stop_codon:yes gene_type:complete